MKSFLFLFISVSTAVILWREENGTQIDILHLNSPEFPLQTRDFNISAGLFIATAHQGCHGIPSEASGQIVYIPTPIYACALEQLLLSCQNAGCVGVLQLVPPGWTEGDFASFDGSASEKNIRKSLPLLQVYYDDIHKWIKRQPKHAEMMARITDGDHNPWISAYHSWIFLVGWRIIMPALAGSCALISAHRLYRWYWIEKKARVHVAIYSLCLELCANTVRCFYCIYSPVNSTFRLTILPGRVLMTCTIPIGMITTILIASVFSEALKGTGMDSIKPKLQWVILLSILLLTIEFVGSVSDGTYLTSQFQSSAILYVLYGVIYLSTQISISVYYAKKSITLLSRMRIGKLATQTEEKRKRLWSMGTHMLFGAISMMLNAGMFLVFVVASLTPEPSKTLTVFWFIYTTVQMISYAHIIVFGLPRMDEEAEKRKKSSKQKPVHRYTSKSKKSSITPVVGGGSSGNTPHILSTASSRAEDGNSLPPPPPLVEAPSKPCAEVSLDVHQP